MSPEREVDEEIRFHIEMRTRANMDAGMSPGRARAEAERTFGDPEVVRSAARALGARGRAGGSRTPLGEPEHPRATERLGRWLSMLREDARLGLRTLRRSRVTTVAALASLALGIGVNTANFSIVHGVLFRPLPFERAEGLLFVDAWSDQRGDGDSPITWADLETLRSSPVFEELGAFQPRSFTMTGGDRPERIAGAAVTPGLFGMLGVRPRVGRLFEPADVADPGLEQVALVSDALWRRLLGADPDAVGRTVHLDGREVVVIGVMEAEFRFPEREDVWLPLGTNDPTDPTRRALWGVGRLRAGAGLDQAQAVADGWAAEAAARFPESHQGWDLRVQSLRHGWVDAGTRRALGLLLASVGFVLLLACANVANLLLARATDRRDELAVRSALGAGRARLAHQMLVESLLLGLAGGALGIVVARLWLDAFVRAIPEEPTFWMRFDMDRTVLLYALAISISTSVLFGLLPALQASRARLGEAVRGAGRGVLGGRGSARAGLVIVEVAMAMILLVSATLMVRSFMALQSADPGFADANLLSLRIVQSGQAYDDAAVRAETYRQMRERLATLPGATSAAVTSAIPADDGGGNIRVLPEGSPEDLALNAISIVATSGLFETLGVELLAGRDFTQQEVLDPEADVVIIGERLARRLWPQAAVLGADVLGRSLVVPGREPFRVIGVAPDVQYEEFGEAFESARLQLYAPYAVSAQRAMSVLVRAAGDPGALAIPVRRELERLDPTLAPYDVLTMRERRALTTWEQGVFGDSFAVFGVIAVVLALCGMYGVIAYAVARRTREIGIRIALGARPAQVRSGVVGGALALAGAGVALGLVGAIAFARALRGILYGVEALDLSVFAGVLVALLMAAAVASWVPARRAARIDPTDALRAP